MREIKFRAWETINKRWLNLWQFLFSATGEVMAVKELGGEQYGLHQVELLQFAGLHDKAGREIYEGDIVNILTSQSPFSAKEDIYTPLAVEYNRERAQFCVTDGHWPPQSLWPYGSPHYVEVIGNIYENPELLTNKSK